MRSTVLSVLLLLCAPLAAGDAPLPAGLILDLNAEAGVETQGEQVLAWRNQVEFKAQLFKATRENGRPTLRKNIPALNGRGALVFKEQDLLNDDEDAFDALTTGSGYTWVTVLCPHAQTGKLKDVNAFIGNLRNGPLYEGFWAGFDDDNTLWIGSRNGKSFGRWNADNPKVKGPKLEPGTFYLLAARMSAGATEATVELFVGTPKPVASATMPVNPKANPSKLAIGTERDAIEHPGVESFDGEIARLLLWNRPLTDAELTATLDALTQLYALKPAVK